MSSIFPGIHHVRKVDFTYDMNDCTAGIQIRIASTLILTTRNQIQTTGKQNPTTREKNQLTNMNTQT